MQGLLPGQVLPQVEGARLMAQPLTRTDTITRCAILAIKQLAQQQNFPDERLKAMQFDVECSYVVTEDCMALRVQWRDPEDRQACRGFRHYIDETLIQQGRSDVLVETIFMAIEQINLRGELFYFKLHRHFPNRIEKVSCTKDGLVTVRFKNGRSLTTNDADLDSTEFLATCGMIYDL